MRPFAYYISVLISYIRYILTISTYKKEPDQVNHCGLLSLDLYPSSTLIVS